MLDKFSVKNILTAWQDNKPLIDAYLKNQSVEGFRMNASSDGGATAGKILGFGVGVFLIVAVVIIALWFWALYVTIKFWSSLPTWARVIAVIGLFFGWTYGIGTVITLIVVYASKGKGMSKFRYY